MTRGRHQRRRQFSPFYLAVIMIVIGLAALCVAVNLFAPGGAA